MRTGIANRTHTVATMVDCHDNQMAAMFFFLCFILVVLILSNNIFGTFKICYQLNKSSELGSGILKKEV